MGIFAILRKLRRKAEPEEEVTVEISLEDLSVLWRTRKEKTGEKVQKEEAKAPRQTSEKPEEKPADSTSREKERWREVILQDFVEPYRGIYASQNALEGTEKLIDLLVEHGNCPSVVPRVKGDVEASVEFPGTGHILERVSLIQHSVRVAKLMVKYLRESFRDPEFFIPKFVVAGLGHDLGKIPALRQSGFYTTGNHAEISADKLLELFRDSEPPWLSEALEAVRNHHRKARDILTHYLRLADGRARMYEVAEISEGFRIAEWDEWFDADEFLERLGSLVNVHQRSEGWKAFSYGDTVYCHPDILWRVAGELAREKKILDASLMREDDMEEVLKKRIVPSLRLKGALSDELPENHYFKKYRIEYRPPIQRKKGVVYLIPIKLSAFPNREEIEKRAEGMPKMVASLQPA